MCDFSTGFKEPEMVKKRPVLVVSKPLKGRSGLTTVLPLSTSTPDDEMEYHYKLPKASLPQLRNFQVKDTWIKADMIYTIGHHRLDLILLNKKGIDGKRLYFKDALGRAQMETIYACMLHGMGLGGLGEFLDQV